MLLDAEREVIRPAILWNDQRTAAEAAEIERIVGIERLVQITGSRSFTGFTAPKLLWLRQNATIAYKRLHHLLLPKDYVRLMLTGELATDVGDASGTGLFDVGARAWSDEIVDALDLDRDVLPPRVRGHGDHRARAARRSPRTSGCVPALPSSRVRATSRRAPSAPARSRRASR